MNNADDILKKILLNMRYDSSKTLKENKLLLEEDKQYVLAWDGRTLELPLNAVINGYHNMSNFNLKPISDSCKDGQFWTAYSKEVPKKTTESPKTDSNLNKELINKSGTENSYDGKELITFDLDL